MKLVVMPKCPQRNDHVGGAPALYAVDVLRGNHVYECHGCGCKFQWFDDFHWRIIRNGVPHDPTAAMPPARRRPQFDNP